MHPHMPASTHAHAPPPQRLLKEKRKKSWKDGLADKVPDHSSVYASLSEPTLESSQTPSFRGCDALFWFL